MTTDTAPPTPDRADEIRAEIEAKRWHLWPDAGPHPERTMVAAVGVVYEHDRAAAAREAALREQRDLWTEEAVRLQVRIDAVLAVCDDDERRTNLPTDLGSLPTGAAFRDDIRAAALGTLTGDAPVKIVGEYYRSRRGDTIHLAPCPRMGSAVRWSFADDKSSHEVASIASAMAHLHLCRHCWPAAALTGDTTEDGESA